MYVFCGARSLKWVEDRTLLPDGNKPDFRFGKKRCAVNSTQYATAQVVISCGRSISGELYAYCSSWMHGVRRPTSHGGRDHVRAPQSDLNPRCAEIRAPRSSTETMQGKQLYLQALCKGETISEVDDDYILYHPRWMTSLHYSTV